MSPFKLNPKHAGMLHRDLGIEPSNKIPLAKLELAIHSKNPSVRRRAQFAKNARGFNHGGS